MSLYFILFNAVIFVTTEGLELGFYFSYSGYEKGNHSRCNVATDKFKQHSKYYSWRYCRKRVRYAAWNWDKRAEFKRWKTNIWMTVNFLFLAPMRLKILRSSPLPNETMSLTLFFGKVDIYADKGRMANTCTPTERMKIYISPRYLKPLRALKTLPIIPRSTPADDVNACLKNSNLWAHVKTLNLTTNMRVRLQNDDSGHTFSDQLLAIWNRKFPVDSISGRIQLPADFCNLVTSKKWIDWKSISEYSKQL